VKWNVEPVWLGLQPDAPAVALHDLLADGEADPRAGYSSSCAALEYREDAPKYSGWIPMPLSSGRSAIPDHGPGGQVDHTPDLTPGGQMDHRWRGLRNLMALPRRFWSNCTNWERSARTTGRGRGHDGPDFSTATARFAIASSKGAVTVDSLEGLAASAIRENASRSLMRDCIRQTHRPCGRSARPHARRAGPCTASGGSARSRPHARNGPAGRGRRRRRTARGRCSSGRAPRATFAGQPRPACVGLGL